MSSGRIGPLLKSGDTVHVTQGDLEGMTGTKHAVKESRDGLAVVGLLVACWCVAVEFFVGVFVTVKALLP